MGFLQRARQRSARQRGRWYQRGALGVGWAMCALLVGAGAWADVSAAAGPSAEPGSDAAQQAQQAAHVGQVRQALQDRVASVRERWLSATDPAGLEATADDRADTQPPKKWNKWSNWANWLNR